MVQRYPSSGKPVELERLPAPPSVLNAVKLMYVGAAVSTVSLVITLADIGGLKTAIKKAKPTWTATQVNQYDRLTWVAVQVGLAFLIALLRPPMSASVITRLTVLTAAPTYMSLTAFRTDGGAGRRSSSTGLPLDG